MIHYGQQGVNHKKKRNKNHNNLLLNKRETIESLQQMGKPQQFITAFELS